MPDLSALNGASSSSARPYTEADYENATRLHRSQSLSEGRFGLSSGLRDVRNARGAGPEYTPPAARSSSAAGMANGTFPASSVSAARTVTAPNASTEEIEMSMKAFARDLIGAHGGERALNANRQLTLLLEGTEPNSATQKYLRKFMYALHMLNVPAMYDSQDAAHMSKRNAMVNAFIDAIDAAAKHHVKQPGKSDEVLAGKLDHNSSTGKSSYKGWSRAWAALNEALSQRSTGASDMQHLEAYYARHVMPRTQLRAQFVYGETTDKAEDRLHSGSKQAVWDASRQLLCCNAVNAEERGLNLASASELLHMMPEFLRRPKNNQDATNPARNQVTDHSRPENQVTDRPRPENQITDRPRPENQITDNQSTEAHRDPAGEVPSDRRGSTPVYAAPPELRDRVLWNSNSNVNGDQIMHGHSLNLYLGSDANRNAGVSTSGHRPGGEPEGAPGNDAAGGLAGGNAGTDDTQRVSTGHRSRRRSSANEAETPVAGPDELAGQPAATTSPLVETHSAPPATPESTRGATEDANQHSNRWLTEFATWERRSRSNSEGSLDSSNSPTPSTSISDLSYAAREGTPSMFRRPPSSNPPVHYAVTDLLSQSLPLETAGARQNGGPSSNVQQAAASGRDRDGRDVPLSSRSGSPSTPRFDVPVPPPLPILSAGVGQRNPAETARARQSFSPTPSEVNGTPPMSRSASLTSSPHDAVPTPSRSASPGTPRFNVPVPPPLPVMSAGVGQRNPVETARARQSFSPTPSEVNGTPPMSRSASSTSSPHDAVPTPSRSASPDTPRFRFNVQQPPQVVLTAGPGQRNPAEAAKVRQSISSPTPDEVE